MGLEPATKHLHSTPMRGLDGLAINQFGKESNSFKIGSLARRVNTHRAMDKQKISKMPKENDQNDKKTFSFLMKYFYNPHMVP